MALVAGTYGLLLRIDLGEDVSGNTGLALSIINPRVETVIRTPVLAPWTWWIVVSCCGRRHTSSMSRCPMTSRWLGGTRCR
jgi:hypothetical protein